MIRIPRSTAEQILDRIPTPRLVDGKLERSMHRRCQRACSEFAADLRQVHRDGYAIVASPPDLVADLRLPTAICSLVGRPFRLVRRWPLWIDLPVDLDAEPHRFGGIGHNPFHIDLVNASAPPPYVCLLALRTDPLGGGHSIVSDLRAAVARLSPEHVAALSLPTFHEGRFFDLQHVGHGLERFAVIERRAQRGPVRFTAKMLADMSLGTQRDALEALDRQLTATQARFLLRPGELLIVDNHRMAHGREALGYPQTEVAPDVRRALHQTYLHSVEAA